MFSVYFSFCVLRCSWSIETTVMLLCARAFYKASFRLKSSFRFTKITHDPLPPSEKIINLNTKLQNKFYMIKFIFGNSVPRMNFNHFTGIWFL